jgi:hypothetical protein
LSPKRIVIFLLVETSLPNSRKRKNQAVVTLPAKYLRYRRSQGLKLLKKNHLVKWRTTTNGKKLLKRNKGIQELGTLVEFNLRVITILLFVITKGNAFPS